ncbi:MAG: RNA methyltransferase [Spirochaetaceae bacterium]|nr:RNA methyltransferase [Spirochaetaceae bacterium]
MDLSEIRIILCRPEESRNIGAVCRAMANCGMNKLRIVGKKTDYDDKKVKTLAIHSAYIWEQAKFYQNITDATKDCSLAAGTTRRVGKKRKNWLLLPEEFAKKVSSIEKVAIIFGNERTGLTDQELDECTLGITIPSNESFASLNLSHAVQLICYTLFRENNPHFSSYTPVPLDRLDKTVASIGKSLKSIGFFSITGQDEMEAFWRNILSRAALSEGECSYIEKTFSKAAGLASKHKKIKNQEQN